MIPQKNDHFGPTNPFRPGMGLDPPYLADRAAQLDRFDNYLTGFPTFPRNVRLTGLRGVGKTVLLQHYAAAAEARGWVVVRRECSEHLQPECTFARALFEDCRSAVEHSSRTLALRQRSSAAARRALDMLGGLTVTLEGVTLAVKPPTFATGQPAMLEDRLFQALELACEGAAAAHHPGVLFCYDEGQVLCDTPRRHQFPLGIFLASVARAQRLGLAVMLVVCGLPTLTDNLARSKRSCSTPFAHLRTASPSHARSKPPATASTRAWSSRFGATQGATHFTSSSSELCYGRRAPRRRPSPIWTSSATGRRSFGRSMVPSSTPAWRGLPGWSGAFWGRSRPGARSPRCSQ